MGIFQYLLMLKGLFHRLPLTLLCPTASFLLSHPTGTMGVVQSSQNQLSHQGQSRQNQLTHPVAAALNDFPRAGHREWCSGGHAGHMHAHLRCGWRGPRRCAHGGARRAGPPALVLAGAGAGAPALACAGGPCTARRHAPQCFKHNASCPFSGIATVQSSP